MEGVLQMSHQTTVTEGNRVIKIKPWMESALKISGAVRHGMGGRAVNGKGRLPKNYE